MLPVLSTPANRIHLGNLNCSNTNKNSNNSNKTENTNSNREISSNSPAIPQLQYAANKRGSGMIFRIEHLVPPTTAPMAPNEMATTISSSSTVSSNPLEPLEKYSKTRSITSSTGVYAAQFLPKNTISDPLPTVAVMASNNSASGRMYCSLSQQGLCMTPEILRKIKLSEDVHSYNALFELHSGQMVRIRIVRDIAAEDEIVVWFGEQISMLMAIPFLTPLNIQGNKRYTCHLCHLTFETPNPLKVHLALGCGRHSMDILWIRLHYAAKTNSYPREYQPVSAIPVPSQTHSPTSLMGRSISISPSNPSTSTAHLRISPTSSPQPAQTTRLSAFKPISPSSGLVSQPTPPSQIRATTSSLNFSHNQNSALSFLPTLSSALQIPSSMNILQPATNNPLNAAAQIEAIVSNMGASKQGHLCIYCGKVYSRKYGLKIHIRTHTGFKPLKCKFCLRPFGDPSNLNKHVRLHLQSGTAAAHNNGIATNSTDSGYKCHVCHKTLARRRDLQRHMETRHSTIQSTTSGEKTS